MAQAVLLYLVEQRGLGHAQFLAGLGQVAAAALQGIAEQVALEGCLLYTSDAADEA